MEAPPRLPPKFVIDTAKTLHRTLTAAQRKMAPPSAVLMEMVSSVWRPHALWLVAHFGIADLLASGPRNVAEIARETQCNEDALFRVLRALAHDGVLAEPEARSFALTPLSEPLRSDHPQSVRNTIRQAMSPRNQNTWMHLEQAVRSGAPQFVKLHGRDVWSYFEDHREEADWFHSSMAELTRISAPLVAAVYDFGRHETLVDVGGGRAMLLSKLLQMFPKLKGIDYDLEPAVKDAPQMLREAGVESRCQIVTGSFLDSIPAGHDAYVLKHIVHGLTDELLAKLFANLREALRPGATLILIEMLVPERGEKGTHPSHLDFQMLVSSGGRERTASEYRELMRKHGFRLDEVLPTPSPIAVIVGTRSELQS